MSTIRFVLRTDKTLKDGTCPIDLIYQLSGTRKHFRTTEKLFKENWLDKEQRAVYLDRKSAKNIVPEVNFDLLPSLKEVGVINTRINHYKKVIADIENRFQLNGVKYSAEMVVDSLKQTKRETYKTEAPTNQVFEFIDKYIQDNKESREPGSLKVYKSLKNHLQNFQTKKKRKVLFEEMNYSFFLEFQNYLITAKSKWAKEGLGNVMIAKLLSTLKTFINYARMHGVEVTDKYKDFKIKTEPLEVIALTMDEFEKLYNYDFSENKRLEQVKDIFIFGCTTGLRYSDILQLKNEHIKKDEIRLTVTKTKEKLNIPLNPYSQAILQKYTSPLRPLPVISNQKMNDYIKEVCEKVGIDEQIQIVRFRGTKRIENFYPKYQLISSHTGRKTFCTLSLEKGMSAEEVMKISGHKNYQSFKRYVNITEKRAKVVMQKAWGELKPSNLKAV